MPVEPVGLYSDIIRMLQPGAPGLPPVSFARESREAKHCRLLALVGGRDLPSLFGLFVELHAGDVLSLELPPEVLFHGPRLRERWSWFRENVLTDAGRGLYEESRPWLGPFVRDWVRFRHRRGKSPAVIVRPPIGFDASRN